MQEQRNKKTIRYFFEIAWVLSFLLLFQNSVQAFEDYVISTNGKLTDIKIADNTIIDVCPHITIMNEKNTLFVHPLKVGKTSFSVLKNNKKICIFYVDVLENETKISGDKDFEILSLDIPPSGFQLDMPPKLKEVR